MRKILFILFGVLVFFVPLVLWPYTSEVFEFNKIVLTYTLTLLIVGVWIIRSTLESKVIFRQTILDIPLLVFIGSQVISTILSIDPQTSFFGYYSRFNGGLLSTICYCLLYWAFVSNFYFKETKKIILVMIASGVIVSVGGVLEHFGFFATCVPINISQSQSTSEYKTEFNALNLDQKFKYIFRTNCWVQDTQSRVFSTLGQPNWLAAWVAAFIPIVWILMAEEKFDLKNKKYLTLFSISVLFFFTLIYTKSRSGMLGLAVSAIVFWVLFGWQQKNEITKFYKPFLAICFSILLIILVSGTQWTPSLGDLLFKHKTLPAEASAKAGPALETGGTESGTIRKIVWKGAIQVWQHYPIFGTGVETFAFAYPRYSPAEHNLVSEWDFVYNKAHNEYLNFLANTGVIGLVSYLTLIGFTILAMFKTKSTLAIGFLAGYISLLVSNFFGFSVVPTQIQFFLFPAMALSLVNNQEEKVKKDNGKLDLSQKLSIVTIILITSYLLVLISRYWYADYLYATGLFNNTQNKPNMAVGFFKSAIDLEPNQPKYHSDLAGSYANLTLAAYNQKDAAKASEYANLALNESQKAIELAPSNTNLKRSRFGIFIMLSTVNRSFLTSARDILITAISEAPTDAKLYYSLGTTYARIGQIDLALDTLKKAIELKSNYRDARLAYAILLTKQNQNLEAKAQLEYILKNIDQNDTITKQTLEGIK